MVHVAHHQVQSRVQWILVFHNSMKEYGEMDQVHIVTITMEHCVKRNLENELLKRIILTIN